MYKSANLATTESMEFEPRGDDAVLGLSRYSVAVATINGHTLTIERYSPAAEVWHSTGDTAITTVCEYIGQCAAGTKYRIVCTGGTGDATVEVSA